MVSRAPTRILLEVMSYYEEDNYVLCLSGHLKTLRMMVNNFDIHDSMVNFLNDACNRKLKNPYDDRGSNICLFAGDYLRITHKFDRSAENNITSREKVAEYLTRNKWKMTAFSALPGQGQPQSDITVVERWIADIDGATWVQM